jgi:hypothetical protein
MDESRTSLSISAHLTEAPIDTRLDLMTFRERLSRLNQLPVVRQILVVVGVLLMALSPLVGAIPGPGGIVVFAAGLSLALKYSGFAKRLYVRFKRKHPYKGRWADWGLRRQSAKRREELEKARQAEAAALAETPVAVEGSD